MTRNDESLSARGTTKARVLAERQKPWWSCNDDDGDPDYSGRPDICIDCHDSGSDFVRAFRLP